MKKTGETTKSFFIHLAFVAVVILGLYFIISTSISLTGYVVLDAETSKAKLETALASSAIFSQVTQGSICVIINDPEQPLSLQAVKSSTGWEVNEMIDYCSGMNVEDVIVQFPDYDSFSKVVDNPSPRAMAEAAMRQDFEIVESKYVELGGNVICDATFKVKYCGALKTMGATEQLIDGDLACCIDTLTKAQKQLLEQHLQEGNFKDEIGIFEESPSGGIALNMTYVLVGIIVFVVLLLGGVAALMLKGGKGKPEVKPGTPGAATPAQPGAPRVAVPGAAMPGVAPPGATTQGMAQGMQPAQPAAAQPAVNLEIVELTNYVQKVLAEGYTWDQIRTHLLEIGWDDQTADKVIQDAQKANQPPPPSA